MQSRRVLLLENPKSGAGNTDVGTFAELLRVRDVQVTTRLLDDPERNPEHVRDALAFDALVVAGGDGTVSSVAYEARSYGRPILAYPAGTANLIAQNLGLPTSPAELAEVLLAGRTVRTDLAELTTGPLRWGFAMLAGIGADAAMIRDSEELKGRLGAGAYLVSALRQFAPTSARFRLDLDEGSLDARRIETEGISVMVANFGMANFRLPVASGIDPTDGRLMVIVLKGRTTLDLLPNLIDSVRARLNLGDPIFEDRLETYECRSVTITADRPMPVQYDGEVCDTSEPVTVRVLPGAARFLTLAGVEGVRT